MARIIGGIATSHTPTIGFAFDAHKQDDSAWLPIFEGCEPVRAWLAEKQPDALLVVYNDHITSFFFDHYSPFSVGVDERYAPADEGGGARGLPPIDGHAELSRHIVKSLVTDEFDISVFRDKPLDHGCFSPLSVLLPHSDDGWSAPIVPLQIGVLQFPIPTARRCYKLGQALRGAIESYPEDISVAIVATGGLSHQVHGERCGFNNTVWDQQFLELFQHDPVALTRMTHGDYARLGGMESSEVIMWLIMRGALSASVRCVHKSYYLPSMTAIATAIYENQANDMPVLDAAQHLYRMGEQLRGVSLLDGTYPYTLERSAAGYRLNKFLYALVDPTSRARFLADEEACFEAFQLSEPERDLVRRRDWRGMIHYGVIFFLLEKLGAVTGISNLHIYAAMRGESLAAFQSTRNQKITYSVAATHHQTAEL